MNRALEQLFSDCFYGDFATRLEGGALEPLYRPASTAGGTAVIYYREDFPASALHEVAHWCIAGDLRRQQEDYGYWYAPDGRDTAQQRAFETVEVLPQAVEWHFSLACMLPFRISLDNLQGELPADSAFPDSVLARVRELCGSGLPARAEQYRKALAQHFGGPAAPVAADFCLEEVR